MAKLAIVAAAAGVGKPANVVWSSSESVSTLNRASRSAAQQANSAAMLQIASLCRLVNCGHIFTSRIAGRKAERHQVAQAVELGAEIARAARDAGDLAVDASNSMASRISARTA